jgi:hypothetical protein
MSDINYTVHGFVTADGHNTRKPVEGCSGKMTMDDAMLTSDELKAKIEYMTFVVLDGEGRERYTAG